MSCVMQALVNDSLRSANITSATNTCTCCISNHTINQSAFASLVGSTSIQLAAEGSFRYAPWSSLSTPNKDTRLFLSFESGCSRLGQRSSTSRNGGGCVELTAGEVRQEMKVSWTRGSTLLVTVVMLKTHGVYLRPHSVSQPLQARCCCLIRPTYCGTKVCAAAITGPTGSNMCTVLLPLCGSFVAVLQLRRKKKEINKWRSQ